MSDIFHKIEHDITHVANEVGHAVEGIAVQKVAEEIVDVLTSPAAVEAEELVVEAAVV